MSLEQSCLIRVAAPDLWNYPPVTAVAAAQPAPAFQ